jgi:hypothetical protein
MEEKNSTEGGETRMQIKTINDTWIAAQTAILFREIGIYFEILEIIEHDVTLVHRIQNYR